MIRRAIGTGLVVLAALLAALPVCAGGFSLALPIYTIDLSSTFTHVPVAAEDAHDAIDRALADYGLPQQDRDEFRAYFEGVLQDVGEALDLFPSIIPVPHLGGALEIELPLLLIDGVRFSGGYISDGVLRTLANLAGFTVPRPLIHVGFDEDGISGAVTADLAFSSWVVRTELRKRFDLLVAALSLGAGVELIGGAIQAQVDVEMPPEFSSGVSDALAALHLDGLAWSAFGMLATIGMEIGPPFLRLAAEVQFVLPVRQTSGWWEIGCSNVGGSVGVVIRF